MDFSVLVLVIGVPALAGLVALALGVWTVRASPQHRRRFVLGLMSTAVSLFALGLCAAPLVPPSLCALLALAVSALGVALSIFGFRARSQTAPTWPCIVGITTNSFVLVVALTLVRENSQHLIDRLEHNPTTATLLGLICSAPLLSVLMIIGIRIWLWLGKKRTVA